eukprot:CAMPEP_0179230996 /NCGR_PEP_ID=MMETSP0797-20121207/11118_1 /TAXON_ID=47934 /ORGANISM="Dinophysis acuminata, Strain DAEP01" /LENGTH=369 /DNA_ID=CAMNT_0020938075 /DNA_START=88 /DNA_END=1197 /DNA_ORIENTATION=+
MLVFCAILFVASTPRSVVAHRGSHRNSDSHIGRASLAPSQASTAGEDKSSGGATSAPPLFTLSGVRPAFSSVDGLDPCKSRPGGLDLTDCTFLGSGTNGVAFRATVPAGLWLHVPSSGIGDRNVTGIVLKTNPRAWDIRPDGGLSDKSYLKHWGELAREAGAMTYLWGSLHGQSLALFQEHMPAPVPSGLLMDSGGIQWLSMELLAGEWSPIQDVVGQIQKERIGGAGDLWASSTSAWAAAVVAVAKLHIVGWQHCDLHAGNVFARTVGPKIEVKLIDFGRAGPRHEGCAEAEAPDADMLVFLLGKLLGASDRSFPAVRAVVETNHPGKKEEFEEILAALKESGQGLSMQSLPTVDKLVRKYKASLLGQ